jgi:polysaccharide export outer membrane protein
VPVPPFFLSRCFFVKSVWFSICFAGLSLAGCAGTPPIEARPGLQVVRTSSLPAPSRADLSAGDRPYLIGPFDKLSIDVFGIEDLSKKVQADASGRISVPLIGGLEAAGRTPAELADEIAARLRGRFVRDPLVTVNLEERVSQVITVDGEVNKPGLYPVIGRMTLLRAVATADGATDLARLDDVVVFRTVEGQRYAAVYNVKAIRRGVYDDPDVYANDLVMVGTSGKAQLLKNAIAVGPALLTPLIYLLGR